MAQVIQNAAFTLRHPFNPTPGDSDCYTVKITDLINSNGEIQIPFPYKSLTDVKIQTTVQCGGGGNTTEFEFSILGAEVSPGVYEILSTAPILLSIPDSLVFLTSHSFGLTTFPAGEIPIPDGVYNVCLVVEYTYEIVRAFATVTETDFDRFTSEKKLTTIDPEAPPSDPLDPFPGSAVPPAVIEEVTAAFQECKCVFIDCGLKCKVVEAIQNGSDPEIKAEILAVYDGVKYAAESRNCCTACDLYMYLILLINRRQLTERC